MSTEPQFASVASHGLNEPGERLRLKDLICAEVRRTVQAAYPKGLVALVLTGSLARNESTVSRDANGWTVHGDVDFFLVSVETDTARDESLRVSTAAQIERNLLSQGVRVHMGINQILPSYLQSLPKYIATFELRKCGEVLLGNQNILSLISDFNPAEISREDAWRMLCNRMIELLEFIPPSDHVPEGDAGLTYATVKLVLDTATSYLVFARLYDPTYRGREAHVRAMVRNRTVVADRSPFNLDGFSKCLTASTHWKLNDVDDGYSGLPSWKDAVRNALDLWHWELVQLTGTTEPIGNNAVWQSWASRQSGEQRIRGWLSVARRSSFSSCVRNAPRWAQLCRRATPRYWIYSAAQSLLADRLNAEAADAVAVAGRSMDGDVSKSLPENHPSGSRSSDAWLAASEIVAANYKKFLVGTLA